MFCSSDSALTLMVIPKNEDILQMVSISVNEMPLGLKCSFSLIAIIIFSFTRNSDTGFLCMYSICLFAFPMSCVPVCCGQYCGQNFIYLVLDFCIGFLFLI